MTSRFAFLTLLLAMTSAAPALAQSWTPPPPSVRCPSRWGASDERGAANYMKPENVRRAMQLVRTGEIFELGHVLAPGIPLVGTRRFDLHTKRTNGPLGTNKRNSNEEIIISEIGQAGTQMDAFVHQGIDGKFYNCLDINAVATRNGFTRMGIDKVGAVYTRGVLIDVAGLKGVATLPTSYEITAADLQAALARQQLTIQPGDAVLIHTGWSRLWGVDNARYLGSAPGVGVGAAEWLVTQNPMLVGADNGPFEVSPNPDAALDLPVHQIMLVVNGIYIVENLRLGELAARRVYEFAFVALPLKIQGGSGSSVAPIAIH